MRKTISAAEIAVLASAAAAFQAIVFFRSSEFDGALTTCSGSFPFNSGGLQALRVPVIGGRFYRSRQSRQSSPPNQSVLPA
jgi:hypothetical protein